MPKGLTNKTFMASLKLCLAMAAAFLCRPFRKKIWLVSERPTQARDNGYCFFRYLREQHPECEAYYLIDESAKDFAKVQPYGNVIRFGSWKHYFYYCLSKIHISAHVNGCCPDGALPASRRLKKLLGFRDIFIPHGVSYGVSEFCLKKYTNIDLFICSGKPEYDNVLANYGYAPDEVAYTGFPRLDGWHHFQKDPKLILVMPTWRLYLAQNPDTVFEETAYYKAYQGLLQDEGLAAFLKQNDLKLVFYLHNEMRKYVDAFRTDCANIEVVYKDETYDIQELLKAAAVLVTDYSSVHFDFAYMDKPVIYFQFDREEFFSKQYQQSGFDAKKDGFGPVAESCGELTAELNKAYANGFAMPKLYHERMRAFYRLYDESNCERVYEAVRKVEAR